MNEKIAKLEKEMRDLAWKMQHASSAEEWESLHREKVCCSRELEYERGY